VKTLIKILAVLSAVGAIFSIAWIGLTPGIATEIGRMLQSRQNNPGASSNPQAASETKNAPQALHAPEFTPTPEIFNPLQPSPTASKNDLPLTCQVTDLEVYINQEWGYCFAYPSGYDLDDAQGANGTVALYGPPLDVSLEPVQVSLVISPVLVPSGSQLSALADAYLSSAAFQNLPWDISRQITQLGGEPAEVLEPLPGRLSYRQVLALHQDRLYTLQFSPVDVNLASSDLEAMYQTVTGSFAFFPTQSIATSIVTTSWYEFGRNIQFSYDSRLAPWVEASTIPAIPASENILFAEAHPVYAQFRCLGFQGGRLYDLPMLPFENRVAQANIFQTADFPGYGDDQALGFPSQLDALQAFLKSPDFDRCGHLYAEDELSLPILPWLYARQAFCSQPKILEFDGGKGVRYLTFYTQDPSPVLDRQIFYTFQGLTEDGKFYIAAFLPVTTGIFPVDPPDCPRCGDPNFNPFVEWEEVTSQELSQLNGLESADFLPHLTALDEMIKTLQIGD
jgi:hypothetical protein